MKDMSQLAQVSQKVLREFAKTTFPSIEAQADGLVTIGMDTRYQVVKVRLQNTDIESSLRTRIEEAILKAVNAGVLEVGKRNGELLIAAVERDLASESSII